MQSPIAEPPPLSRQHPQPLQDRHVIGTAAGIAERLRCHADKFARPTLRIAPLLHRPAHGGPPQAGRHEFFARRSFSVDTSSIDSASSFLSLAFSSSSAFSRFASDTSMPPYFERHL